MTTPNKSSCFPWYQRFRPPKRRKGRSHGNRCCLHAHQRFSVPATDADNYVAHKDGDFRCTVTTYCNEVREPPDYPPLYHCTRNTLLLMLKWEGGHQFVLALLTFIVLNSSTSCALFVSSPCPETSLRTASSAISATVSSASDLPSSDIRSSPSTPDTGESPTAPVTSTDVVAAPASPFVLTLPELMAPASKTSSARRSRSLSLASSSVSTANRCRSSSKKSAPASSSPSAALLPPFPDFPCATPPPPPPPPWSAPRDTFLTARDLREEAPSSRDVVATTSSALVRSLTRDRSILRPPPLRPPPPEILAWMYSTRRFVTGRPLRAGIGANSVRVVEGRERRWYLTRRPTFQVEGATESSVQERELATIRMLLDSQSVRNARRRRGGQTPIGATLVQRPPHIDPPTHLPRTHFSEQVHGAAKIPRDRRRVHGNVICNLFHTQGVQPKTRPVNKLL